MLHGATDIAIVRAPRTGSAGAGGRHKVSHRKKIHCGVDMGGKTSKMRLPRSGPADARGRPKVSTVKKFEDGVDKEEKTSKMRLPR